MRWSERLERARAMFAVAALYICVLISKRRAKYLSFLIATICYRRIATNLENLGIRDGAYREILQERLIRNDNFFFF